MIKGEINYSNLMPKKSAVNVVRIMLLKMVKPVMANSCLNVRIAGASS
jgi:hypothetical protein